MKNIPWPEVTEEARRHFKAWIDREVEERRRTYQNHEPFHEFLFPAKVNDCAGSCTALGFSPEALLDELGEQMVAEAYGFTADILLGATGGDP